MIQSFSHMLAKASELADPFADAKNSGCPSLAVIGGWIPFPYINGNGKMIGLLLKDVSDRVVFSAISKVADGAYAVWFASAFEDVIESASEALEDRKGEVFCWQELNLPFLNRGKIEMVKNTLVFGYGADALGFLVDGPRKILASADLKVNALVDYLRVLHLGHFADLRWCATKVEEMADLAEWSIWSELPDPVQSGHLQLLLAREASFLAKIDREIRHAIDCEINNGSSPSASVRGSASVSLIDVETELRRAAPTYDGNNGSWDTQEVE